MKQIYGTYRPERIEQPVYLPDGRSLNGGYTPSMYLTNQFGDWFNAGLTNIKDSEISEEKYTREIAPGVKKLTRFIIGEYNEDYVDPTEFSRSLTNVGARFDIDMFTDIEIARQWIRDNTDLQEVETGKFELQEQSIGINGETIEATYLIID